MASQENSPRARRRVTRTKEKSTGIYRCTGDVENLKFRVRIREIIDESLSETVQYKEIEEKTLRWQEKILGIWEEELYRNESNCTTDLHRAYHAKLINSANTERGILHTYVNADYFCKQEDEHSITTSTNRAHTRCTQNVNYANIEKLYGTKSDIMHHISNPFIQNNYEYMYVVADFGKDIDETWDRKEHILCTIKYDISKNILFIYPDFMETCSYRIIINEENPKIYEYSVENYFKDVAFMPLTSEEKSLNKIEDHLRKSRLLDLNMDFSSPPVNKLFIFLFFEILNVINLENGDVQVRYFLDLPENWLCSNPTHLEGSTQYCITSKNGGAYFGQPFDILLSCDAETMQANKAIPLPTIYFEVVSRGTWSRYQTLGLAYTTIPIVKAGCHCFTLQCLRISPGSLSGKLRRFFIGDYRLYDDITWIARPKGHEGKTLNKYGVMTTATGQLEFRVNVVHQSRHFDCQKQQMCRKENIVLNKRLTSSALLSAEEVLEAFKVARRNMMKAKMEA